MPRSFLITNRRYSPQVAKLKHPSNSSQQEINLDNKLNTQNATFELGSLLTQKSSHNNRNVFIKSQNKSLTHNLLASKFDLADEFGENINNDDDDDLDDNDDELDDNYDHEVPLNLQIKLKPNLIADDKSDGDKTLIDDIYSQTTSDDNLMISTDDSLDQTKFDDIKDFLNLTPPSSPFHSPTNDIHICPDCGKRYSTSSNLTRHRQTHRSVNDKKARKCPHCDKVYVSMPAYSMHVRTHTQGCQCHFCGKCFSRPWLLQGHIRTHTGEKPFKCHICSKSFADKSNLRAHVQTHSLTKPYICQRCSKAFALKSYLYKHEESSCMRMHRNLVKEFKDTDSYQQQVTNQA